MGFCNRIWRLLKWMQREGRNSRESVHARWSFAKEWKSQEGLFSNFFETDVFGAEAKDLEKA